MSDAVSDEVTVLDLGDGVEWAGALSHHNDPRPRLPEPQANPPAKSPKSS